MGATQPFMYAAYQRDVRFPSTSFDPRAVTRASREPKSKKARPTGPLVSFSQHPDTHEILQPRTARHTALAPLTKALIKWLRRLQLSLRLLQLVGAAGILVLFSLFKSVDTPTTWAVRIMQAVTILHCIYAIVHLSRKVTARTPASTAAYQFFSVTLDLLSTVAYVIGVFVVRGKASSWSTILSNQKLMNNFVPAVYYTLMGASGLHFLIISSSLWLGWTFRKISLMPPDISPLEDFSTARAYHKKSKSSTSTQNTGDRGEKVPWTPSDSRRHFTQQSSKANRISFMDTRVMDTRVKSSNGATGKRISADSPNRQYRISTGSPTRDSTSFDIENRRALPRFSPRGSYMEVASAEPVQSLLLESLSHDPEGEYTANKKETWVLAESSMSRMTQRNAVSGAGRRGHHSRGSKSYAALTQQCGADGCSSGSDYEEDRVDRFLATPNVADPPFPESLGSHPTSPDRNARRTFQQGRRSWSFMNHQVDGALSDTGTSRKIKGPHLVAEMNESRPRNSSIQTEEFFAVSYGEMRSATPPILVGNARKVSGNDYASRYPALPYDRRNASKVAEEGYA